LTFNWRPLNELIIITLRCAAQCIVIGPVCGFSTAGGRCPNLAIASARAVFASLWALFHYYIVSYPEDGSLAQRNQLLVDEQRVLVRVQVDSHGARVDEVDAQSDVTITQQRAVLVAPRNKNIRAN